MSNLCKTSSNEEMKQYFAGIMTLAKSNEQFPVNLDDVWPLVYNHKRGAVEALKKSELFIEGIDYVQKDDEFILPNVRQNKSDENDDESEETRGRKSETYHLSLSCLEFFIARKVRPVFEVYRKVFHYATLKTDDYLLSVVPETFYNLTADSTIADITGFIGDMYREEQRGNIFPIFLPEVFALFFPTMGSAIDELLHHSFGYVDGQHYIHKQDGNKTGYYLSFNGFNHLIACRCTLVERAYTRAWKQELIPDIPAILKSERKLTEVKVPKRLMKIRNIQGTKKEQASELTDRIMALIGQSEYIEEVNILNEVLNGMMRYNNFMASIEEED